MPLDFLPQQAPGAYRVPIQGGHKANLALVDNNRLRVAHLEKGKLIECLDFDFALQVFYRLAGNQHPVIDHLAGQFTAS